MTSKINRAAVCAVTGGILCLHKEQLTLLTIVYEAQTVGGFLPFRTVFSCSFAEF